MGRTSGFGDPASIVRKRDYGHHMSRLGYGPAVISTVSQSVTPLGFATRFDDPAYWAIRGSEQLQIESFRKMGISGNLRNGIGDGNKFIQKFLEYGSKF